MADVLTTQVGGTHYKDYKYQPIEFFMDLNLSPAIHSAIKYLTRIGADKDSGGLGIDKTIHYIQIFEAYWGEQRNHPIGYYPNYSSKLQSFTKQFPSEIGDIIEKIALLDMGAGWTVPVPYSRDSQSIISTALSINCQAIIHELNKLKEKYYAN